jgi:hypothetical protein
MEIGFFSFNSSSGSSMVEKSKSEWIANYENIIWLLNLIEKAEKFPYMLLPISRWIGSGNKKVTGDAIESISLSSTLLAQSKKTKVFSTVHTFSHLPETVAHTSVFLNEAFENRFAVNLVCGWKEDEIKYFNIDGWDYEKRYEVAEEWVSRFRVAEKQYSQIRGNKIKTSLINAAFSKEGRNFAKNNVDNLFTTIPSNFDIDKKNENLQDKYVAATLIFEPEIENAISKYENLLKISDQDAALEYAKAIKKSDKMKGNMYLSNQPMVQTGSGLPVLIVDESKLLSLIEYLKRSNCKGLAINLNNYFDAEKIVDTLENKY